MFNQNKSKPHRPYKIVLKSPNGNTIGHINLTSQFLKAMIGKDEAYITLEDIASINQGRVLEYLMNSKASLEPVEATKPRIDITQY